MKIIQVIPNLRLAGAEIMCETLSVQLAQRGHAVKVVSLYEEKTAITQRLEEKNIPVLFLGKKPGADFSMIRKLAELFRKEKPDVVHTHLYALKYAAAACALAGVKGKIHTMHNVAEKETTPRNRKISRFLFWHMGVVPVSLSEEIQKTVESCYGLSAEKTPVIYNGIDLSLCVPGQAEDTENVQYLHIGRFSPQKNHAMLLEAFAKVKKELPGAELVLVGEGNGQKAVQARAEEMHLQESVFFAGAQSDVHPFLQKADVFVLPSLYEGMPMTIIEAMATGLPVAATAVGGVTTMIENGREGILTETDPDDFARAMLQLGRSTELRRQYGRAAKEKAQKLFSAESMACKYEELYRKILGEEA